MGTDHLTKAVEYYRLIGKKDVEGIKKYLDPNVKFSSPLATLQGKEAVVEATSHFMKAITSLTIRAQFSAGDQAMVVYQVDIPDMAKDFPGASLLSFRNGLIVSIELFHDGSRFAKKKEEIFS